MTGTLPLPAPALNRLAPLSTVESLNGEADEDEVNQPASITTGDATVLPEAPRRRRLRLILMLLVPALILLTGGYFWATSGRTETTDNAEVGAPVASIAPEVSGRIVEVAVRENQHVAAGQLLFRLDPAPFRIALLQAQAALDTARVQYAQAQGTASSRTADIGNRQAAIASARANVGLAQQNFDRQAALLKQGFTTRANYDAARAALLSAQQAVSAAEADARSAAASAQAAQAALGTGSAGAPPAVEAALAQVEQAKLNLARTEMRAPFAGRVTQTDRLQPGNLAPQQLPVLSLVADGGSWIEANFKETQLPRIRPGQRAMVSLDAIPGRRFAARVISIGAGTGSQFAVLPAQNATGNWVKVTQRVPVRLQLLEDPGRPLVAGQSAKVTVDITS